MEAAAVEGSAVLEYGVDGLQEFAHDGTDGLDLLEAMGLDDALAAAWIGPAMATHCLALMSSGRTRRLPRSWMALAAAMPVPLTRRSNRASAKSR